jgi:hypothetical protein
MTTSNLTNLTAITQAKIVANIGWSETNIVPVSTNLRIHNTQSSYTFGISTGQINQIYADTIDIDSNNAIELDISGQGSWIATPIVSPSGQIIAFNKIYGIVIVNTSTTATIVISNNNDATNTVIPKELSLHPGAQFQLVVSITDTGYVVDSSNILKITNSNISNSATIDIVIIGQQT